MCRRHYTELDKLSALHLGIVATAIGIIETLINAFSSAVILLKTHDLVSLAIEDV